VLGEKLKYTAAAFAGRHAPFFHWCVETGVVSVIVLIIDAVLCRWHLFCIFKRKNLSHSVVLQPTMRRAHDSVHEAADGDAAPPTWVASL